MKKTVRLLAAVMVAAMLLSLCACAGSDEGLSTTQYENVEKMSEIDLNSLSTTAAPTTTEAAAQSAEDAGEAETTTSIVEAPAPETVDEILQYYNAATAKVSKNKVAFSKTRSTEQGEYTAGVALDAFKSLVYKFMGIGEENKYVAEVQKNDENYDRYIKTATLGKDEVKDATITKSGNNYVITIKIQDGSSSIEGGSKYKYYAPIDKSGIGMGINDKDYYDHKTAQNVYDAIDDVAKGANIVEKYSNAVLTATIDSTTGNLTALSVTFDISFDLSNVLGSKGYATGTTTVDYSKFVW